MGFIDTIKDLYEYDKKCIEEWKEKKAIYNAWDYVNLHIVKYKNKTDKYILKSVELIADGEATGIIYTGKGDSFKDLLAIRDKIEELLKLKIIIRKNSNNRNEIKFLMEETLEYKLYILFLNNKTEQCKMYSCIKDKDILNPNEEKVGEQFKINIPIGKEYSDFKSLEYKISNTIGKTYIEWDSKHLRAILKIITEPIVDKYKFVPIKCNPWQLYIGMKYDYTPVILNYKDSANTLIGGKNGTGKTVSLISAFINLIVQHSNIDIHIIIMGEKTDLRIFRDLKQTKSYSVKREDVIINLKKLNKEMERRNKLFEKDIFTFNIYEYNNKAKNKLNFIHIISDEVADFGDDEEIQALLWSLARKGRSAGIYITLATQRGSLANMSSEIKGLLGNKVCFNMPNTASALTIMGIEGVASKVTQLEKQREFLVDYQEGLFLGKTLYLDNTMIRNYLKDLIVKKKDDPIKVDVKKEPRFLRKVK